MPKSTLINLMLAPTLLSLSASCVLHSGHALAVKRQLTSPTIASPRVEETNTQKMLIMPSSRVTITLKGGERVVGEYITKRLAPAAVNEGQSTQMTRSNNVLLATPKPPAGLSIQILTEKQSVWIPVHQIASIEFNKRRNKTVHVTVGALVSAAPPTFFVLWVGNSLNLETSETTVTLALAGALFGALPGILIGTLTSAIPGARTAIQLGDEWSFE